ncbi:carbonyl reductase [Spathaspora passalidarum NRRL Y-27907]|uniref:Carbonyl reductase n=1 Tax=Spathaspora passalidarum (strain NRRL Y-27907 / 11-Y1) TaxID=619300 RepID=G3ANV0_SPAPN|nr:carbonyl reductase [Spathaspora passalidarum NRRL Y-27907]EGW32575.1 carbonyl reductase [Spathaspora passalidarum NRRL Y-27907]
MSPIRSYINPGVGSLPTQPPKLAINVLDLFSLKGKVATVTGSSQGIGLAVAEAFAQAGADIAIWYNSNADAVAKADEFAKKYGVRAKAYKCHIGVAAEVEKVIGEIEHDFGTIDIFVANAGITWTQGPVLDVDGYDTWQELIDLNYSGVYYCAHAVGKIFRKNGKGSLIFTSSISASIVNVPQSQTPYNVTKAAVKHLAKSLAVEWAPFARVNTVSPGYIITSITDFVDPETREKWWQFTPMGREGITQEVVGAFLYLASDASTYTTGSDIVVDGGYTCP